MSRVSLPDLPLPSLASGSQKIGDFMGVALQVQQHEVLFASLKRTICKNDIGNHVKTLKKGSTDTVPPCFPHFSRLIKRLDQVFLPVDKAQKTLRKGNKGTVLPHFPRFPRL